MKFTKAGTKTTIISVDSGFNSSSENELLKLFRSSAYGIYNNFILDFSNTGQMESSSPGVLVKLHAAARKSQDRLYAFGLKQSFIELFRLTGLDQGFHICATIQEVIEATNIKDKGVVAQIQGHLGKAGDSAPANLSCWSPYLKKLQVPAMPAGVINLNIDGRKAAGPIQGFGQLWEKTYKLHLTDIALSPPQVIEIMKANFTGFQPPQNRFYPSEHGIKPGEIIIINASTPGGLIATGVLVLYADEHSFIFITPQGHPEAGWVTFTAYEENGSTMMQIQGLARASDLIYEAAFRLLGSNLQQQIWTHVLESLARHVESKATVQFSRQCLDYSLQWSRFSNIFQNAQISSMVYAISHPFRSSRK
jgi:anti-anti-sigma regulatory factor